jgi:hypothetical protein
MNTLNKNAIKFIVLLMNILLIHVLKVLYLFSYFYINIKKHLYK